MVSKKKCGRCREIKPVDRLTETTDKLWTVDHIVPLQNPLVCGLHCEANLRIILGADNFAKCNRWWPDMPEAA